MSDTEQSLPTGQSPLPVTMHRCPRCNGEGGDPRLEPPQSCLVCWGEGEVSLHRETWDGQHRKLLEHIMCHPHWNDASKMLVGSCTAHRCAVHGPGRDCCGRTVFGAPGEVVR